MMRLMLLVILCLGSPIGAAASLVDPLLTQTGPPFVEILDALSHNSVAVAQLRKMHYSGMDSPNLRRELLRRLVLARVDAPKAFASFKKLISLNHMGSPLYPSSWKYWRGDEPLDELFLRIKLDTWMQKAPSEADWLHPPPPGTTPDPIILANKIWPPIAYGLSAQPSRLRALMRPVFGEWCIQDSFGDLSIEAFFWLCERTEYDPTVVADYSATIYRAMRAPNNNKGALATRELDMLSSGEHFVKADNSLAVDDYINTVELYGNRNNVIELQDIAAMPIWSSYRVLLLKVAHQLEVNDKNKSDVVARELIGLTHTDKLVYVLVADDIPEIMDTAIKYGNESDAPLIRQLAERPAWKIYRARMLQVARYLESHSGSTLQK